MLQNLQLLKVVLNIVNALTDLPALIQDRIRVFRPKELPFGARGSISTFVPATDLVSGSIINTGSHANHSCLCPLLAEHHCTEIRKMLVPLRMAVPLHMAASRIRLLVKCCMIVVVHCIHHSALVPSGRKGSISLRSCVKERVSDISSTKWYLCERS